MPSTRPDSFNHALATANNWLAEVGAALGTSDRQFARRVLRAWLHTLRDRLTVDSIAKFGAQLPELMRGIYYDGWEPSRTPVKYGVDQYIQRFAWEARVPVADVPEVAAAITAALDERLSAGQMDETLAALPAELRNVLQGGLPPSSSQQPAGVPDDRLRAIDEKVNTLADAVRTLARGLEDRRLSGVDTGQVSRGARLADEILMTIGP